MNILVIGGAGFIGSHMVKLLGKLGANITILDNLSTGHLDSVLYGNFIYGDFGDKTVLKKVFSNKFDAVMHFASSIIVNESIINPHKYYENNLINTVNLLGVMKNSDVKNLIFSSTAAIFGDPIYIPIDEKHLQNPINSYGRSKFLVENILVDYQNAYNLKSICLRYFNAAGADPDGELGERHDPETHLIPLILRVASGKSDSINVFGQDYDTPDGTCIRDFIHEHYR